jgi:hypothetical protein
LPKVKTYLRSGSSSQLPGGADQGLARLKSAQERLEIARVEARSTLAPILERMKKGRDIRSAEKVLRSMSALLEYPHSMRLALDKGNLKDVVALYQRVQAIPSTSALKIVQKIKAAADSVIADLKKLCFSAVLAQNASYSDIMKHAQLILRLDGGAAYANLLRQALTRHLLVFWEAVRTCRAKFCLDIVEAYDRGEELNLMVKNNLFTQTERDSVAVSKKKYASNAGSGSRRRGSRGHTQKRGPSSNSYGASSQRSVSNSSSGLLQLDDELLDGNEDFDDSNASQNLDEELSSSFYNEGGNGSEGFSQEKDDADLMNYGTEASNVDYTELLCSVVRKAFGEGLIGLTCRWFPLLYK